MISPRFRESRDGCAAHFNRKYMIGPVFCKGSPRYAEIRKTGADVTTADACWHTVKAAAILDKLKKAMAGPDKRQVGRLAQGEGPGGDGQKRFEQGREPAFRFTFVLPFFFGGLLGAFSL